MRTEVLNHIKANQIEAINLENLNIQDYEISEILNKIKSQYPTVKHISLNGNKISKKGAAILEKECADLKSLEFLDLQFNQLRREGIAAMLRIKETHPTLTNVALHGNGVTNVRELIEIKKEVHESLHSLLR